MINLHYNSNLFNFEIIGVLSVMHQNNNFADLYIKTNYQVNSSSFGSISCDIE